MLWSKLSLALLLGALMGGLLVWLLDPVHRDDAAVAAAVAAPPEPEPRSGPDPEVESRPRELERSMLALEDQAEALEPAGAAEQGLQEQQRAVRPPETADEEASRLDAQLESEQPDPNWAPGFERGVVAAFSSEVLKDSRVQEIECGATLCRMEVAHDTQQAHDTFDISFPEAAPDHEAAFFRRFGDEQTGFTTVAFLARTGSGSLMGQMPGSAP